MARERNKRDNNAKLKKKPKWISKTPLGVCKGAKDPIHGESPQITTKQKQENDLQDQNRN